MDLADYDSIETEPWFGNNLQKIVSLTASMATYYFRDCLVDIIHDQLYSWSSLDWNNKEEMEANSARLVELYGADFSKDDDYNNTIQSAFCKKPAFFDSRAFIVPREEIFNVLYVCFEIGNVFFYSV